MTLDEYACWIADGRNLTQGSHTWRAVHDRAMEALHAVEDEALEQAAEIADQYANTEPKDGPNANIIASSISSAGSWIAAAIRSLKD